METNLIYRGDCKKVLKEEFPDDCVDLIYVDPPFSFDPKYAKLWYDKASFKMFEELRKGDVKHYIGWMSERLQQFQRVLKETGSMYLHCDWKFGHHLKIEMDEIFGKENFRNEIIWHYTGGGRSKKYFSRKHDTIFLYSKTSDFTFNIDEIRIPYKETSGYARAGIAGKNGKRYMPHPNGTPIDDVWDIPIINPLSKERRGYPTQKPEALLERIIRASSNPEDSVLDPMCGCGTTMATAYKLGRKPVGIDISSRACNEMKKRMIELGRDIPIKIIPEFIEDLKELNPYEFQDYACKKLGGTSSRTKVADGGIDGYINNILLQVKQSESIGRNAIDNFETAVRRKKKNRGIFVAFSFTRTAYEEIARAKSEDNLDIKLIEAEKLLSEVNVGSLFD